MAYSSLKELESALRDRNVSYGGLTNNPNFERRHLLTPVENEPVEKKESLILRRLIAFLKQCTWFTVEYLEELQVYKQEKVRLLKVRIIDPLLIDLLKPKHDRIQKSVLHGKNIESDVLYFYLGLDSTALTHYLSLGWRINKDLIRGGKYASNTWVREPVIYLPGIEELESDAVRLALLIEQLRIILSCRSKADGYIVGANGSEIVRKYDSFSDDFAFWLSEATHKFLFFDEMLESTSILYKSCLDDVQYLFEALITFLNTGKLPANFFKNSHQYHRNGKGVDKPNTTSRKKPKEKGRFGVNNNRNGQSRSF